jgi:hypothetical protein
MDATDDVKNTNKEAHQFQKRVALEIFLSNIVTIVIFFLSLYDYLPWKVVDVEGRKHVSFKARFIFTLQLAFIDILPVLVCVFAVYNQRRQTSAVNPVNSKGKQNVKRSKRILKNTLRQFIIKLILSFILCTILHSHELLLLPTFTLLFIIGRFTFALGYPNHRSFGVTMNSIIILLVTLLITYRLLFQGFIFRYIYWK